MAKYTIALMPGDGVGKEVVEAAMIVLDKVKLDAEFIEAQIGWEFWKTEGNPLPDRTIRILKNTTCALFGAITSKPKEEAAQELALELREKGYVYYSPIVRLRQESDSGHKKNRIHTPCRPEGRQESVPAKCPSGLDAPIVEEAEQQTDADLQRPPRAMGA